MPYDRQGYPLPDEGDTDYCYDCGEPIDFCECYLDDPFGYGPDRGFDDYDDDDDFDEGPH